MRRRWPRIRHRMTTGEWLMLVAIAPALTALLAILDAVRGTL